MNCRYKTKIVKAGEMIFGVSYAEFGQPGVKGRRGKFRPTSEVQERLNERNSRMQLTYMIHENFDKTSISVDVSFSDRYLPETDAEFRREIRNYLKRVEKLYIRAGKEFRWICIRAFGEEKGRLHLHFVFSGGVDEKAIKAKWGRGRVNYKQLEFDEMGVVDLSQYLGGQKTAGARRWTCSRNCRKPVEKVDRNLWSSKKLRMIAETSGTNRQQMFAEMYPGYWLSEQPRVVQNPVNGSWYMTFVMYQPDGKNLAEYARRGK